MSFAAPFWLLFLAPWLGVVLWLLSGQRYRVAVPFLDLWSGPVSSPKPKRTIQPPPVALALVLVGLFFAILGAAGPELHSARETARVILIVDRGITMTPTGRRAQLYSSIPNLSIDHMVFVPAWKGSDWKSAPSSAINTQQLLEDAVAHELTNSNLPIVVISDQKLLRLDPRIIQMAPQAMVQNVDIVNFSVSTSPKPQAMVRIRNQSSLKSCQLTVSSGGQKVSRSVLLSNEQNTAFVDLPAIADSIEARIDVADDLAADNVAYLVRARRWPQIEVRSEISPELRRMVEVYRSHRAASEESQRVAIVSNVNFAPTNEPAVILSDDRSAKPTSGRDEVVGHPVTANIDWSKFAIDAVAAESPADGWTALVRRGDQVLIAAREKPVRQVWIGFTSANFPKRSDYVIFWTDVFDWLGGDGDEFRSESVHALGGNWKIRTPGASEPFDLPPGIYRRDDGAGKALNVTDVRFQPPPKNDWRRQLALLSRSPADAIDAGPVAIVLAMLLVLGSGLLWKPRSSFSI